MTVQDLSRDYTIRGKYRIVEKIGKGTMGTSIYLGNDLENNSDVIIRVLPKDFLYDEEMSTRFMQGINLAKKLHHPNILRVLDAGKEKDIEYVITNYEKGFLLNAYLEHRGELDENESVILVKSLCEALDYAWNEQQIIHRNICPDTILVAKHNVPMLTDFDLAKSLISDSKLTVAGFAIGNPIYMSPEQAKGETVDFRSDMYCLGLVFYQLLAGSPPFNSKARMDTLCSQISEKHAPIQSKNKRITDACSSVLDKMLAKDMKDRYQSWKTVIDDLDAILNQKTPSTLQKAAVQPISTNYKMQAIHMPSSKATDADAGEMKAAIKTAPSSAKHAISSQTSSSRINVIIIALFVTILVIAGVVKGLMQKKPNETGIETKSQIHPKPELKQAAQPETRTTPLEKPGTETIPEATAVVEPKTQAQPVSEIKSAAKTEPATSPLMKSKPETTLEKGSVASEADKAAKEEMHRKACINNIKQIGVALQMYANVFEGKFPDASGAKGLNQLRSGGFLEHPQAYICPATGNMPAAYGKPITEECCDYIYVGGLSEYSDGNTPILWCKPENHKDYGNILYVNGEVKAVSGSNWLSQTKEKKSK